MNQLEITMGNVAIVEFMGYKIKKIENPGGLYDGMYYFHNPINLRETIKTRLTYHKDWNELIRACKVFDMLDIDDLSDFDKELYIIRCDDLDNSMTWYEIEEVFKQMVVCAEWYVRAVQRKNQ